MRWRGVFDSVGWGGQTRARLKTVFVASYAVAKKRKIQPTQRPNKHGRRLTWHAVAGDATDTEKRNVLWHSPEHAHLAPSHATYNTLMVPSFTPMGADRLATTVCRFSPLPSTMYTDPGMLASE